MGFFSDLSRKTSETTGKIARETKLKLKINENKGKITDIYEEIGKKVYEKHIREENIDIKDFTEFANSFSGAPIQQTQSWTVLKNNWKPHFCGIYKADVLCGVCLILVRELLPGFKYAYASRGPLLDYGDKEVIKAFRDGAEKFCKANGIYSITIDPLIPVGKTLPEIPAENFLDIFDLEKGKEHFQNFVDTHGLSLF